MRIYYYVEAGLIQLIRGKFLDFLQVEFQQYCRRRKYRQQSAKIKWWESHKRSDKSIQFKLQSGVKIKLCFDSALSKLIYCYDFELLERKFINSFLCPGDIFVDVGANIGLFTLIAAKLVGEKGSVYAFEPCSLTYNRLKSNIKLNGFSNVYCQQVALSNCNSQENITLSLDGFDAWNSLAKPTAGEVFASELINTMRWDDFAVQHQLQGKVTLMKIDVEGWETYVLSGGAETLSREDAPTLLIEFTEQAARLANSSCHKLYQTLEKLGYQMFIYNSDNRDLTPYPSQLNFPNLNLIAAKQAEIVKARLKTAKKTQWLR